MDLKEYNRLHGKGIKATPIKERSKRTKQSILTLNTNDVFLNSECVFELEIPIHINHAGRDFYVYKGKRSGISYQINYATSPDLTEKKILKSSQIHTSFFSIVKTLGLSHAAKKIYKLLESYDLHVSGQANLTTLRWNQNKHQEGEICISHEGNKDLIFSGQFMNGVCINESQRFELFKIKDKCPYSFVLTETLDPTDRIVSSYKLGRELNETIAHYGREIEKHFIELI